LLVAVGFRRADGLILSYLLDFVELGHDADFDCLVQSGHNAQTWQKKERQNKSKDKKRGQRKAKDVMKSGWLFRSSRNTSRQQGTWSASNAKGQSADKNNWGKG
jgi:hypothetical protein